MGACTYGAAVKAGESDWYEVTQADINSWFSGYPIPFLWWVNGWAGRSYSLSLLALLNPNVPPSLSWQDMLLSGISGGRWGAIGSLSTAMDDLIQYHVFRDHCVCLAGVGGCYASPAAADAGDIPINPIWWRVVGGSGSTNPIPVSCTGATLHMQFPTASSSYKFKWGFRATPAAGIPQTETSDSNWDTQSLSFSGSTTTELVVYIWRDGGAVNGVPFNWYIEYTGCPGGSPGTPTAAPGVTTAGMPTPAAPSGTTSDQLMSQLLTMQYQINQTAELVRSQSLLAGLPLVAGTVHSGLTGDGEFDCVALAGVRLQMSGVPASAVDRWISHPDEYSGAGRISFDTGGGWVRNVEAAHLDQYIPCEAPASVKVGYHFLAGITATITEYPA